MNRRCHKERNQQGETETVWMFLLSLVTSLRQENNISKTTFIREIIKSKKSRFLRRLNGCRKLKHGWSLTLSRKQPTPRARSQAGQFHTLCPRMLFAWCDAEFAGVVLPCTNLSHIYAGCQGRLLTFTHHSGSNPPARWWPEPCSPCWVR